MNKLPCEVIQDLIPLYVDGVCSAKSKLYIEEHLKSCETCRNYLAEMKGEIPMLSNVMKTDNLYENEMRFFKGLRKKINKERGILIGIILVMLVSIFAALIFPKITTYPGKVREIGRYVKIDNGKHVIVDDRMQKYFIMIPQSDNLFKGLTIGDRITIITDGASLDAQSSDSINVIRCEKNRDGDINDVPESVIEEFIELGYLDAKEYGY